MLSSLLGVRLVLWMGRSVPLPAPPAVIDALDEVEVRNDGDGVDGFQLTFTLGKSRLGDFGLVGEAALQPLSRVVIGVLIGAVPAVLIDGVVTHHQTQASSEPGRSLLEEIGGLRCIGGAPPHESTFSRVPLRTRVTTGEGNRAAAVAIAYKLLRASRGPLAARRRAELVPLVRAGARFIDGELVERDDTQHEDDDQDPHYDEARAAGRSPHPQLLTIAPGINLVAPEPYCGAAPTRPAPQHPLALPE